MKHTKPQWLGSGEKNQTSMCVSVCLCVCTCTVWFVWTSPGESWPAQGVGRLLVMLPLLGRINSFDCPSSKKETVKKNMTEWIKRGGGGWTLHTHRWESRRKKQKQNDIKPNGTIRPYLDSRNGTTRRPNFLISNYVFFIEAKNITRRQLKASLHRRPVFFKDHFYFASSPEFVACALVVVAFQPNNVQVVSHQLAQTFSRFLFPPFILLE